MRHAAFPITLAVPDLWLSHMRRALDAESLTADDDAVLWGPSRRHPRRW